MPFTGTELERMFTDQVVATPAGGRFDFVHFADRLNARLAGLADPGVLPVRRQLALVGKCRVCGCTDMMACCVPDARVILRSCHWVNEEHTLCDNPECLVAAAAVAVGWDRAATKTPPPPVPAA